LICFVSVSAVAKNTNEAEEPVEPLKSEDDEEPEPEGRIIIRKGFSLRIRAIGLTPRIGDYVKVEYNLRRLGHKQDTFSVVGTSITISNFKLDRGTYTVTARIGVVTASKSRFYFFGLFL